MSEYIPLDVQVEILKRLPVKPLLQFRSVSKQWKSLIDSPKFIAAYGFRETQPNRLILRYKPTIDSDETFLTFVDDNDHSFLKQDFVPTLPDLIKNNLKRNSIVVGSSHGLLCFHGYYKYRIHDCNYVGPEIVVLWNPSIRRSIGIEVTKLFGSPNYQVIGFGVCPVTFDPTIVKIENFDVGIPWKVGVYTLSTENWSILSTNLTSNLIKLLGSQVVIGRFIYWLSLNKPHPLRMILSFDLTTKEFNEINFSDGLTHPLCRIWTISKLKESLVLLANHREFKEDLGVCSIWMMKEQGLNRSFTKLYNINKPDDEISRLLGFRKTGELILETFNYYPRLETYDPNSEDTVDLRIVGEYSSFFMCSFMESLLLVDLGREWKIL